MRDTQLDIYRALLMIYIPCVIHVMYLLADGGEPFMSLLLVEMPLVFFVSGASLSVSRSRRGLWSTVVNRFKRILVPYYIYAAVLLAIAAVATIGMKSAGVTGELPLDVTRYGWKDVAAVLLAQDIPQYPFMWHLWFIPPYLILSCTFPWQVRLMEKTGRWPYIAACLLLFLAVRLLTDQPLLLQVLAYNVFMVAGFLFYRRMNSLAMLLCGTVALAVVLLGVLVWGTPFTPMQAHKFPPDWLYVAYNILALCVLALVLGRIRLPGNRILSLWNVRGYNIYLYQSVAFAVIELLRRYAPVCFPHPLLRAVVDGVMVFVLLTVISCVTYPLERRVMRKLRLIA